MNIENIKVGDKFSTETKLLTKVGFDKTKSLDSKKSQIKEIQRYISYEKTGKLSRGKVTNEIIITEIYDVPKEKEDNRNGGNNRSIISDEIHDYIVCNLDLPYSVIVGSKSGIIKQIGLVDSEFSNCYYNFDETFSHIVNGESVPYSSIEKEFFFDYCDKVMGSYKNRLNRVLDNFSDAINIEKFYQTSKLTQGKHGNEFYTVEDITDKETIEKINKIIENLEFTYGVNKNSDKWKIFSNRNKSNKYYDDFVGQVRTLLNDDAIENCYEILWITRNEDSDVEFEYKCECNEDDSMKFNKAQSKFVNDKIESTFKISKSIYDTYNREYIKVPKYNKEDISDDMINDCIDMVNTNINMTIDNKTGEVFF